MTGMAIWKRKRIAQMLGGLPHFATGTAAAAKAHGSGGAVACWASRFPADLRSACTAKAVPIWQVEDGFVRSSGLGAALVQPCSIVVDRLGIYYDPSGPSDLEHILQFKDYSVAERARSRLLIDQLIAADITKYNLKGRRVSLPPGRRVVLVPGQVEGDRSVLLGGYGIRTMAQLLERVRAQEPDAFIVFKPHPDVVAGLRQGDVSVGPDADLSVPDADLISLIERVDVVHTLTSLAGFEALLRGRDVVVHGQPFYAGWGLTRDLAPVARRTRSRTVEELVAAALIDYPIYADPETGETCSVEHLVLKLAAAASPKPVGLVARSAAWIASYRAESQPFNE
jgi:capsule polysaccharide export protein KpsC/LpsZ